MLKKGVESVRSGGHRWRRVRLQLSRARLLEAGKRWVVPLTFVEKLLCGRDTNSEEWGQLAMIGQSCIGTEKPGRQPKAVRGSQGCK